MTKTTKRTEFNYRQSLIAGSVAGMLTKTMIAPLDRLKILFQVNDQKFTIQNGINLTKEMIRSHGVLDLWRGNTASMVRVMPYSAIQFTVHEKCKSHFDIQSYEKKLKKPFWCFLAGALSGMIAMTITYPLDTARARMAVYVHYNNLLDVFLKSFKSKHPLYKGYVPAVLAVAPYTGTSFLIYDHFKSRYFFQVKNKDATKTEAVIENLFLGTLVSVIGQTLIYPLDVIRRRLQTDINVGEGTIYDILKHIYTKQGWHGLFNGISMSYIKGPFAIGSSMFLFDYVHKFLTRID